MREIPNNNKIFTINKTQIILTMDSCMDLPVEAVVLSANNRLILRGATGMAGWLGKKCPSLHDKCQRQRRSNEIHAGRGILPGAGIITDGPDHKKIIHAVSVDYDHPGNINKPYANIATVAAATQYSIQASLDANFSSIAISPMCTRGHANKYLPKIIAEQLLPVIQIQVIFGRIMTFNHAVTIRQIYFCFSGGKDTANKNRQFLLVQNELTRLLSLYSK
jgi:hypothetical protein